MAGVKHHEDLVAWQLSESLRQAVVALLAKPTVARHLEFCDQIRRSSRSVCQNLREAWAKRRYQAHFVSKLTDCDGENSETDTSLDFAMKCGYLDVDGHRQLTGLCTEIGKMLGSMISNPLPFLLTPDP